MTETTPPPPPTPTPTPMADNALTRLRAYGKGNGLEEKDFQLVESKEKLCTIPALLKLVPHVDLDGKSYAGPAKGKNATTFPSLQALKEEAERIRQSFLGKNDWLKEATEELRNLPGHGWGLDGGKVVLPSGEKRLMATEPCPGCGGKGLLPCPECGESGKISCFHCRETRQEICPNCQGRGTDPNNQRQPCPQCQGLKIIPCRYCNATGFLDCAACNGKGGTTCHTCEGTGAVTQETTVSAFVEIRFRLKQGVNLPSGLLRIMERVGQKKIAVEAEQIEMTKPDPEEIPPEQADFVLNAKLAYADIKIKIGPKPMLIASFGKNGRLSGVYPYLDASLKPWLALLGKAASGKESIEKAAKARALNDALHLVLQGKIHPNELRRLYPVGLSGDAAAFIMRNLSASLRQATLSARLIAAASLALAGTASFGLLFLTPLYPLALRSVPPLALHFGVPIFFMGLTWFSLTKAATYALRRRFPSAAINENQKTGRIGLALLFFFLLLGLGAVYWHKAVFGL